MLSTLTRTALILTLLLASYSARAATLNVVDGQLLGAFDVEVEGNLYDVEFLDGTCSVLFSNCDSASDDFSFSNAFHTGIASQALLDQVFVNGVAGDFDSNPESTVGCAGLTECFVLTPYAVQVGFNGFVTYRSARNAQTSSLDEVASGVINPDTNTGTRDFQVYAVWSPVPEPGTAVLMGLGLLAMGVRGRR